MSVRIIPDEKQPSATIEIPLEKPLPDYDLHELEQPTPRNIDAILVTQGFRDLVDDARGVLTDLLSGTGFEITQLTGAICPDDEESYRPGLWIVVRDTRAAQGRDLPSESRARVSAAAEELVKRLQLA
jgi:hypothetical protein